MLLVRDGAGTIYLNAVLVVPEGGWSSMTCGRSVGMVRGRAMGRSSAWGTAGVPARGVAGSVPGTGTVMYGSALSMG